MAMAAGISAQSYPHDLGRTRAAAGRRFRLGAAMLVPGQQGSAGRFVQGLGAHRQLLVAIGPPVPRRGRPEAHVVPLVVVHQAMLRRTNWAILSRNSWTSLCMLVRP